MGDIVVTSFSNSSQKSNPIYPVHFCMNVVLLVRLPGLENMLVLVLG